MTCRKVGGVRMKKLRLRHQLHLHMRIDTRQWTTYVVHCTADEERWSTLVHRETTSSLTVHCFCRVYPSVIVHASNGELPTSAKDKQFTTPPRTPPDEAPFDQSAKFTVISQSCIETGLNKPDKPSRRWCQSTPYVGGSCTYQNLVRSYLGI